MKKIKKIVTLSILLFILSNISDIINYNPDGGISVYDDNDANPAIKN